MGLFKEIADEYSERCSTARLSDMTDAQIEEFIENDIMMFDERRVIKNGTERDRRNLLAAMRKAYEEDKEIHICRIETEGVYDGAPPKLDAYFPIIVRNETEKTKFI